MNATQVTEKLRAESARFGTEPYLLTQGEDGRPHASKVSTEWQGDRIVASAGTRSTANVAARPLLSLLWPPIEPGGYSLMVDGDGRLTGRGADTRIIVTPTRGVLQRPGKPAASTAGGCSSDCIPLLG
jgi:hypothetical protein